MAGTIINVPLSFQNAFLIELEYSIGFSMYYVNYFEVCIFKWLQAILEETIN